MTTRRALVVIALRESHHPLRPRTSGTYTSCSRLATHATASS